MCVATKYAKEGFIMTIGEKIKYLRQKNGITQEKLAEYLNITYQSISKWENNNALPDVTLIVPLANFFGVSTDELFDRTAGMQEAEIEELCKRDYDLAHIPSKETVYERVTLWREAVQKYPRDFRCLEYLAYALFATLDRDFDESEYQQNAREMIAICERILHDSTDNRFRESAIQLLVLTYGRPYLDVADEKKAVEYAHMASSIYTCREILMESIGFTEEGKKRRREQRHQNNLVLMGFLCGNIVHSPEPCTPEESTFALETAVKLWDTLIYDGNFLFYHSRVGHYCVLLAKKYAELGHDETAMTWLEKAYDHVKAFDESPAECKMHYTSIFVCAATCSRHPLDGCMEDLKRDMSDSCFDVLRKNPRFQELAKIIDM
ncbi:MAG: helix-turn-helix transcriptional regulator [Ruminococcaceae bacterium]|nr:helix-turn-helix transcriptional regulator [Oscillospiraceae bacterium]